MDNHWLMGSEVLSILRKLRTRLQAEFGTRLRLSDRSFERVLALAKTNTVDTETRQLLARLEALRGEPFRSGDEPPVRLYRGNPVLTEPRRKDIYELIYGEELARHDPSRRDRLRQVKIYRGNPVLA